MQTAFSPPRKPHAHPHPSLRGGGTPGNALVQVPQGDDTEVFYARLREKAPTVDGRLFSCITRDNAKDLRYPNSGDGGIVPSFVQRSIPYVVRVVLLRGGKDSGGTGTVMQYRCGQAGPDTYVSEEWYLVTCTHVVCEDGTRVPGCYVLFFDEVGSAPVRVNVDVSSARVLSPVPTSPDLRPRSPDALDMAVVRCELLPWGKGLVCRGWDGWKRFHADIDAVVFLCTSTW